MAATDQRTGTRPGSRADLTAGEWRIVYAADVVVHHHPSPGRHSSDARIAAITRAAVLTAVLRLSWRIWTRVRAAARTPATRRGLMHAARNLPGAMRHRRTAPEHVQLLLDQLSTPLQS